MNSSSSTSVNNPLTTWGTYPVVATGLSTGLAYLGKVFAPVHNPITASFPAVATLAALTTTLTTALSTSFDILLTKVKDQSRKIFLKTATEHVLTKAATVGASAASLALFNNYVVVRYLSKNFGPISTSTTAAVAAVVFAVKFGPELFKQAKASQVTNVQIVNPQEASRLAQEPVLSAALSSATDV